MNSEPTQTQNKLAWMNTVQAWRIALGLFVLALLVFAAVPIANVVLQESIKDYELWYDTGQKVWNGEEIYPAKRKQKFPFMYPPTAAFLLAPVTLLGQLGVVVALLLLNAAAWFASIALSVRLAAGDWRRRHLLLYAIPSLAIGVFAWSNFHLGQPSLLLLALMLGAFLGLQTKRQALAGALIALAAAIKAFPFILIVYLLYRRYWIAAGSLLVSLAFFLLLLPTPFIGFDRARADLQKWTQGMLLKYDDEGVAQRPGRSHSWKNQSIFGLTNRLLRHVDADYQYNPHEPLYANLTDLSFEAVNRIIFGAGLALGLIYIAVLPRRTRRTPESDAIEFALLILLLLLFTPLAFGYLFACLLFPFTVLVQRWLTRPSALLLGAGALAVFLLALSIPLQRTAQTYGNYFFATLILFSVLAFELWKMKRSFRGGAAPLGPRP